MILYAGVHPLSSVSLRINKRNLAGSRLIPEPARLLHLNMILSLVIPLKSLRLEAPAEGRRNVADAPRAALRRSRTRRSPDAFVLRETSGVSCKKAPPLARTWISRNTFVSRSAFAPPSASICRRSTRKIRRIPRKALYEAAVSDERGQAVSRLACVHLYGSHCVFKAPAGRWQPSCRRNFPNSF